MKLKGTDINIAFSLNGGQTWKWFGYARNASLKKSTKVVNVSTPDTGTWEDSIPGRHSWSMSISCLLSDDIATIETLFKNGTKFKVKFAEIDRTSTSTNAVSTGKADTGTAFIKSLDKGADLHAMATLKIELQGCGELTYA